MKRGEKLLSQEQYARKYPYYALECAVKGMLLSKGYRETTEVLEDYYRRSDDEDLTVILSLSDEELSELNKLKK
jgi:hypothetical protein